MLDSTLFGMLTAKPVYSDEGEVVDVFQADRDSEASVNTTSDLVDASSGDDVSPPHTPVAQGQ